MKFPTVAALALALTASAVALAQPPAQSPVPSRPPLVRENATIQLSPHVWAIPDESAPMVPNVGFVVGSSGVLVVDTGMGARNGETVLKAAQRLAPGRQIYIVTTHFHPEHDLGAHAFPPAARMIRSRDQEADIAEFGLQLAQAFSRMNETNAELLRGATFRKADIVFDKEHDLDLGGLTARILAMGPNHTRGDTAVWVAAERVLFSGDVAMKGQPSFASPYSRIAHWLTSLERLSALRPQIVVPSHGPRGGAEIIEGYQDYFGIIQSMTAILKRMNASRDDVVAALTREMVERYPDRNRLAGAIRAAYDEAPAAPPPPS